MEELVEGAEQYVGGTGGSDRYDFSTLPEVAWVQIMQYLSIYERYQLSQTCQALFEHFHHPSLWSTVKVVLTGGVHNFTMNKTVVPSRVVTMIDKFGHLYQKLTVKIYGHLSSFDEESRTILTKLSEKCRLESLNIEAGKLISQYDIGGIKPFKSGLKIFINFVKNAYRLKHFNLMSWPMYPALFNQSDLNIFEALVQNKNIKDLETLSLFWRDDSSWSEREPLLPSPSFLTTIIPHLENLQHLYVRSPMLSDDLLAVFAAPNRTKLKMLKIYVTYSAFNQAFQIPDISSATWKTVTTACPELTVECSVMSQVPFEQLSLLLNPDVPLASITFLRYSRLNGQILASIADKFRSTLLNFISHASCSEMDAELMYLVSKCSNLQKLVFHGPIKCTTIVTLVTQKEEKFSTLEFVENEIITIEEDPLLAEDDEIIRKNEDGEYILVDLNRFHQSDDNREENIKQMCNAVSEVMGYNWKPVPKSSIQN